MPTYLVHGFRWPREGFTGIRVHAIVHNLEDCSVEYIQNENSKHDLLESFRKSHPQLMKDIETDGRSLDFIEQYDPDDLTGAHSVSQPYAFVADKVVTVGRADSSGICLSLDIEELMTAGPGSTIAGSKALADLRDTIAHGEKIGWWMVYNGDPERYYDSEYDDEGDDGNASTPTQQTTPEETPALSQTLQEEQAYKPVVPEKEPKIVGSQHRVPVPTPTRASEPGGSGATLAVRERPEPKVSEPSQKSTPEPAKSKEATPKTGFRKKFFGKKT